MTSEAHGLLLFDKPAGWTSHDVVAAVKRMMPPSTKVGHTGTLDPLATGLLIILVGRCTRWQGTFQGFDKTYAGTIRLGLRTNTGDVDGKVVERSPVPALSLTRLAAELASFQGVFESAAPAYSAVKHRGRPLYDYARRGVEVPVKPRRSMVREWTAVAYAAPDLTHRLSCSSGTYVRSLAEALGEKIGCGATVTSLRRDRIGEFSVDGAMTLEQLKAASPEEIRRRAEAGLSLCDRVSRPSR